MVVARLLRSCIASNTEIFDVTESSGVLPKMLHEQAKNARLNIKTNFLINLVIKSKKNSRNQLFLVPGYSGFQPIKTIIILKY